MSEQEKLPPGTLMTLAIIFLAGLVDGLDATIVTVSLPTMAQEFGITPTHSSWIMFAYVVGLAAFLIPLGKMAKNGRVRKFMLLGTALFGISSFLCGISNNFWMLVFFRLIQGISAAMMSSVLPSMVVHMLPVDRKGLGMSILGASSGLALILGPVLGGLIVSSLSWHWLFYINVPICIVILLMATSHMPKDVPRDPDKDPTMFGGMGVMLLIGSVLVLMEDLGDSDMNLWGRTICVILAVIGSILLIRSIKIDKKRMVISMEMLKNREYLVVGSAFLLCTIVVAGAQYLMPYMLQHYWDLPTFDSGIYLASASVAMVIFVIPVGRMCDKFGCKWPAAMAAILRGTFCAIMIYMVYETKEPLLVIIPLLVLGVSNAFSGTAQPTRMIHHSTPGYEDESTNFMLVVNYVASALGCVLFAMVFGIFSPGQIEELGKDGLMNGFIPTMWMSIALLVLALICTLSVKNKIVKKE